MDDRCKARFLFSTQRAIVLDVWHSVVLDRVHFSLLNSLSWGILFIHGVGFKASNGQGNLLCLINSELCTLYTTVR